MHCEHKISDHKKGNGGFIGRIIVIDRHDIFCCLDKIIPDVSGEYQSVLTHDERKIFDGLGGEKRQREWLSGRLAGKKLLVNIHKKGFILAEPPELSILPIESKAPAVHHNGKMLQNLRISISHSNELVLAAVSLSGKLLGLGTDLEKVERRESSFYRTAFTKRELKIAEQNIGRHNEENMDEILRKKIGSSMNPFHKYMTKIYTLKEAVSKALGIGFSVSTHDIEIFETFSTNKLSPDTAEGTLPDAEYDFVLHGKALKRFNSLKAYRFHARSWTLGALLDNEPFEKLKYEYHVSFVILN